MPVTHLILHAYGSWHPDHPDGYHQHNHPHPLRTNINLGQHRRASQRWPTIPFTPNLQPNLLDMAKDIADRRHWRIHALLINPTHFHIVVSWPSAPPLPALTLQTTFKRLLALHCAKLCNLPSRRWYSDGGTPIPVTDQAHLTHLITSYLPDQPGLFWKEPPP